MLKGCNHNQMSQRRYLTKANPSFWLNRFSSNVCGFFCVSDGIRIGRSKTIELFGFFQHRWFLPTSMGSFMQAKALEGEEQVDYRTIWVLPTLVRFFDVYIGFFVQARAPRMSSEQDYPIVCKFFQRSCVLLYKQRHQKGSCLHFARCHLLLSKTSNVLK